jgi:hypothetical protein
MLVLVKKEKRTIFLRKAEKNLILYNAKKQTL